ncbi:hypothetical protein GLYMA_10G115901v4 [Glycine max]|nr:hypothetical protein GLYMA_10G115901v4 [Glycine max]
MVLWLEKQCPSDVGVIVAFFVNHVKVAPDEALFLGANEPHAYICGECIECMATSDNVVRAGLTPKHRDVQSLCSMLTYKQAVCTEAGMFALRERRVHVTQEDFEMAVAKVMKKETEKNMSLRKLWK